MTLFKKKFYASKMNWMMLYKVTEVHEDGSVDVEAYAKASVKKWKSGDLVCTFSNQKKSYFKELTNEESEIVSRWIHRD